MVDSGAGCSLVTQETIPVAGCSLVTKGIIEQLKPINLTPPDGVLRDASQNAIELISKTRLPIRMNGNKSELIKTEVDFLCFKFRGYELCFVGAKFHESIRFNRIEFRIEADKSGTFGVMGWNAV